MRLRAWLREAWELIGADLPLFSAAAFLTIALSLFSAFILAFPLTVGLCLMLAEKLHGRRPELSLLWEGITQHFPAAIMIYMITMAAAVPFDAVNYVLHLRPAPWPTLGFVVVVLGAWLVSTPLFFALPLVADRDLSARDAISLSWTRFRVKPLPVFATTAVCGVLLCLGVFACGVGIILTLPLVAGVLVLATRDLVGNFAVPRMTSLREDELEEVGSDDAS